MKLSEDTKEFPAGTKISHYRIVSKIGAGGMGEVYLARDTKLERRVAVKFLSEKFNNDTETLSRFVQEAQAVSALNHPNILTVYEIGEIGGVKYIVTEFIEGDTLREFILQKSSVKIDEILQIALQTAEALAAAHRAGIVHRDIKPENVMIRRDGYVKVLDFGLAKLIESKPSGEDDKTLVQSFPGIVRGTVKYMSPEQARGKKVDARTDIWSFGVMFYELLTRRAPFSGETATDVMLSIIQKEPPPLHHFALALPDELIEIVNRTLRKNLDERYQNIADVAADLRRVKQRLDYEEISRSLAPEKTPAPKELGQRSTEVLAAGVTYSNEAAVKTSEVHPPPNNLSGELSPLIDRETERAEIVKLLMQPEIRLLTLTGVGGTGKTRLARAAAGESFASFADGVYFIELGAIENPELILPVIGQTLGVREEGGKSLREQLTNFLRERRMLLVLDNFEQITEAAPLVGELLASSTNLKILVTSRVRLNLRLERELTVQPLDVPIDKQLSAQELGAYPAIELFVERACAVKPGFVLTDTNAEAVVQICRRLDGLPLAIELAAVRVKLLTPPAILTRLNNSLKLLTGGARDLPERQQTMRGAIAWSYDLLDENEKKLFNLLAVFTGGFTLDGAEAVANASNADAEIDVLDGVSSLVDKSLLVQREQLDGESRFRMLVVVKEYAVEKLNESGEADEVKHRHADFFAALAEESEPELVGENAAEWFEKLETEHDNLRSALEWSLDREPATALRIAGANYRFWLRRGYLAEGGGWLEQALEKSGAAESDPKPRAKACRGIGILRSQQGDFATAESFYEESLHLSRSIADKPAISHALGGLGSIKALRGDLAAGRILLEEGLEIARELNDQPRVANTLNSLGEIHREEQDFQAARTAYEEAYTIAKRESFNAFIPVYAANLTSITCLLEDYSAARSYCLETLETSEKIGDKIMTGNALDRFGALAVKAGNAKKAARLWGAAQAIYDGIGYKLEKVERDFNEKYIIEARTAIGASFDDEYAKGYNLSVEKAVNLVARERD